MVKVAKEEKVFLSSAENRRLMASLWPGYSDSIIIMAHGSGSNRYANGRFKNIALDLQNSGYSILAFDFSGHGESDDVIFNTNISICDVKAAVSYARGQGYKRVALFAHSFGAFSCFKAWSSDVNTIISCGGVTGPIDWPWKNNYSSEQIEKILTDGYITSSVNDGLREVVKCDVRVFDDIMAINQQEMFSKISCPVLFIHGNVDAEERKLTSYSEKALSFLAENSAVTLINGADHSFSGNIKEVVSIIKPWCKRFL